MKIIAKISLLIILGTVLFSSCNKQADEQLEMLRAESEAAKAMAEKQQQLAMEQQVKSVEQMRMVEAKLDSSLVLIDSLQKELQKCKK